MERGEISSLAAGARTNPLGLSVAHGFVARLQSSSDVFHRPARLIQVQANLRGWFVSGSPPFVSDSPPFVSDAPSFVGDSPPFVSGSPPFVGGSPPFVDDSPPFVDGSPPFVDRSPPFVNRSPPFVDRSQSAMIFAGGVFGDPLRGI